MGIYCMAQETQTINLEGWDEEGDEREVQKGEDICIPMADSCRGLTENNKILESNYPSIKKKIFFKEKLWWREQAKGRWTNFQSVFNEAQ